MEVIIEKMKGIKWTRKKLELIATAFIVLFALTVFTLPLKSQERLIYSDGKLVYTGTVVNYRMNGQGKLVYENGDIYEGDFDNGVFQGQGKFTSHQGWIYEGSFKNGLAHGQGTLTTKAQKVYQGRFKQGIYQDEN